MTRCNEEGNINSHQGYGVFLCVWVGERALCVKPSVQKLSDEPSGSLIAAGCNNASSSSPLLSSYQSISPDRCGGVATFSSALKYSKLIMSVQRRTLLYLSTN